ncbi:MAG: penicillin-binding protein 1C [Deltaproteobacteria bacterium]|jgi:penicillin-binding protein 1C|nr:penicillin-binding protein 1C [Deltaproteobacteria bacterium]
MISKDPTTNSKPKISKTLFRWSRKCLKLSIRLAFVFFLLFGLFYLSLGFFPDPLSAPRSWDWTVTVTDRNGRILKQILPPAMIRKEEMELSEFSPNLIAAVIAAEDKRFRRHIGVDPLAVLRAFKLNVSAGAVKSGGSTITMQLSRLLLGLNPKPRTYSRKIKEAFLALLIERHHTKEEILALYLNMVPAGGQNVGFQAAAKAYLGKGADRLSASEAAFLASLPASPGKMGGFKPTQRALERKEWIVQRMERLGYIDADTAKRGLEEPLILLESARAFKAPHFVNYLLDSLGENPPAVLATTLDLELQDEIQRLAANTVERFKGQGLRQAAVIVMSLPEREVLAYVGSADFFNPHDGQIDGVTTLRQPGSALKPFIYALALESKELTAATFISDMTADFSIPSGVYAPTNYSGLSHGPVTARMALASSLNLPAIKLTAHLGVKKVLDKLRLLGLNLTHDEEYYGLGLALGGGEVSLLDLTTAYAALADGGRLLPPVFAPSRQNPPPRQVLSPTSAFIISDILSDNPARTTGFGPSGPLNTPYPSSVKTGTSKNFRDNWCIGYTSGFVVGVWAGNFQNLPMEKVSGVTGAGQLWREITDLLTLYRTPLAPEIPAGVQSVRICPLSGLPVGSDCPNSKNEYFITGTVPTEKCDHSLHARNWASAKRFPEDLKVLGAETKFGFTNPKRGEIFAWDPRLNAEFQKIQATVQSDPSVDELVFYLNGAEIERRSVSGKSRATILLNFAKGRQTLMVAGLSGGRPVKKDSTVFLVK